MSTYVRKVFVVGFAVIPFLFSSFAISEEIKNKPDRRFSVLYRVDNVIKNETVFREYQFEVYSKPEPHYKLQIKKDVTKELVSTEVQAEWNKITLTPGQQYYADLSLTENIADIEEDTRVFGRIEIKSIHDHSIVSAWPVFGTVEIGKVEKRKELYVATLTAFMQEGQKMIITDMYIKNHYHLPVYRRSVFLDKNGGVLSDMQFTLR